MRIKKHTSKEAIAYDFKADLLKADRLTALLRCFSFESVFVCVYAQEPSLINFDRSALLNYHIIEKSGMLVAEAKTAQSNLFFLSISSTAEEIIIWNTYTSFDLFLKSQSEEEKFFSFRNAREETETSTFFLDFRPMESNEVSIICDTNLADDVTQEKAEAFFRTLG